MIDARNPAPLWINGGWDDPVFGGEPSTYLRVNNAAFLTWMETIKVDEFSNPLWVSLEDDSTPPNQLDLLVLGVHDNIAGTSAYYDLVVRGDSLPAWVTGGVRYTLIGEKCVHNVTQSGQWAYAAIPGSTTTFTANPNSSLTSEMVGWILQPDINVPVYLPITAVDPQTQTISVAGNYGFMVQTAYNAPRFRIYAPPGAARSNSRAGVFNTFTSADGSRCLFGGYRYESPLFGFYDSPSKQPVLRQTGSNFAGQYYTLYRNYDPVLMKFTTQDPAAAPFHNLNAYCANNPGSCYDPDGLLPYVGVDQGFQAKVGEVVWDMAKWFGNAVWDLTHGNTNTIDRTAEGMAQTMIDRKQAGAYSYEERKAFAVTDALGLTGTYELATRQSSVDGRVLTNEELEQRAAQTFVLAATVVVTHSGFRGLGRAKAPGLTTTTAPVRTLSATATSEAAILKSIRRHAERLVAGKAKSSSIEVQIQVNAIRRRVAAGQYGAAGSRFHSLNFRFARIAKDRGFLRNLQIEPRMASAGIGSVRYRKPDYFFRGGGIYDIKPWRPSRTAFDRSAQFRDIHAATGTMPVPLYYRLRIP